MRQLVELLEGFLKRYKLNYVDFEDLSANTSKSIGVAISINRNAQNFNHVALFFPYNDDIVLLHLGWHNYLIFSAVDRSDDYHFYKIVDDWVADEYIEFAGNCVRIYEQYKNGKLFIPYSIGYSGANVVEKAGIICIDNLRYGLTCATFVIAVLRGFDEELSLLRHGEWKHRNDDFEFHEMIMSELRKSVNSGYATLAHYHNVESERNCARIRPEDVAAATRAFINPVGFRFCDYLGKKVHISLR